MTGVVIIFGFILAIGLACIYRFRNELKGFLRHPLSFMRRSATEVYEAGAGLLATALVMMVLLPVVTYMPVPVFLAIGLIWATLVISGFALGLVGVWKDRRMRRLSGLHRENGWN